MPFFRPRLVVLRTALAIGEGRSFDQGLDEPTRSPPLLLAPLLSTAAPDLLLLLRHFPFFKHGAFFTWKPCVTVKKKI